jgi:hypothetical protein
MNQKMDSLRVLYWNVHKKNDLDIVEDLIESQSPDILILSECTLAVATRLSVRIGFTVVNPILDKKPKTILLHNLLKAKVTLKQEYKQRMNIYKVVFPSITVLLAAVHLPSKIRADRVNQLSEAIDHVQQILAVETTEACKNTMVVGDFNMNPFDDGMIAGNGFNSVMSEVIARNVTRTVNRKKYEYFFNPVWRTYGSNTENYGTYYLEYPDHSSFHWNIYDQALVRPCLLAEYQFDYNALGDEVYFNSGGSGFSDHAPILAQLERRK